MRMTEQERRIRIRHLKRMHRIRERKERHDKKVSGLFMKVFRFLSVEGGAMALIKSVKTVKGTKSNGEIQHNDEPEQDDEEVQG